MNAPSTGFILRELLPHETGFDYAQAIREINRRLSYDEIAGFCGYDSRSSVGRILTGQVPSHPQGEAIYILYVELFGKKPPLRVADAAQRPIR